MLAIPVQRANRSQDRPVHRTKSVNEKFRRCLDNIMIGLKPGDETLITIPRSQPAKSQERMHLMQVTAHGSSQHIQIMHQGIAWHLQQRALSMQHSPDEFVQGSVPFRIAMTNNQI